MDLIGPRHNARETPRQRLCQQRVDHLRRHRPPLLVEQIYLCLLDVVREIILQIRQAELGLFRRVPQQSTGEAVAAKGLLVGGHDLTDDRRETVEGRHDGRVRNRILQQFSDRLAVGEHRRHDNTLKLSDHLTAVAVRRDLLVDQAAKPLESLSLGGLGGLGDRRHELVEREQRVLAEVAGGLLKPFDVRQHRADGILSEAGVDAKHEVVEEKRRRAILDEMAADDRADVDELADGDLRQIGLRQHAAQDTVGLLALLGG